MTIKITHHPFNYNYAAIPISMAVAFIAVPACAASGNITASDIWLCIAAFIAPTAISSVLMHFPKATLSCNGEKLDFNYLWVKNSIAISDIKAVWYSYGRENQRYSRLGRIILCVKTSDGKEYDFSDYIDAEDILSKLDNITNCNVPLLNMYRYLAETCPEKAKGYIKNDKFEE